MLKDHANPTLTAEPRIILGTRCATRTLAAGRSSSVHLSTDVISTGTVVAGIKFRKPFAVPELRQTTTNPIGIGPDHGRVMANGSAESKDKRDKL